MSNKIAQRIRHRKKLVNCCAVWGRLWYLLSIGKHPRKEETMNKQMETCGICFEDYLEENTKDHQCPDTFCGACGEQYDPTTEQDENGFHLSEICGANDEIKELDPALNCECGYQH
jgi:hypothetical protein